MPVSRERSSTVSAPKIGALLAIIALIMRRNLHETDDFIASKAVARRA
jgi:hypothetical protein